VVLDTNYFRALKAADLAPLHAQGFEFSVGMSAFYETWAAAAREGKPGIIIGPSKELRAIVDPALPIAPNAGDILRRFAIRRGASERAKVTPRYVAWATLNWQIASTGNVDDAALQSVGLDADTYLTRRGRSWKEYARLLPATEQGLLKEAGPRRGRARLVAHITGSLSSRGLRAGLARRRLHAFFQVAALHMWNTALGATMSTENDSEDLVSLMHLAEPAYLLTHDDKLIRAVDAAGTYQAPWVVRLSELMDENRPRGRPWGIAARELAAGFRRPECTGRCALCRRA